MKTFKTLWLLFISMLKIGLFTFGGGYAMIHILDNEFVGKKKWLDHDEFMDLVAIAESTPGPIAINCATYIGYKKEKILGAMIATLGMALPSFCIIYLISLFFRIFVIPFGFCDRKDSFPFTSSLFHQHYPIITISAN
jgi:chromate transporter